MVTDARHEARRAIDAAPVPDVLADQTFAEASGAVLDFLRQHVPDVVWTVTRVENGRQTHLFVDRDNRYDIAPGDSVAWEDTFCTHMSDGTTPAVATDATQVPEYAEAARRLGVDIKSYAGAVIDSPGGAMFGVICGIDSEIRDDDHVFRDIGPTLQILGRMLSMVLVTESSRDHIAAALLRAQLAAETDALTGLYNRRAWERVVVQEESRLSTYGNPVAAVMVDLDRLKHVNDTHGHAAGDEYIRVAGAALTDAVREDDVVARIGGDEFAVLLPGCTDAEAPVVVDRIYGELARAGVEGSVGWSSITAARGFRAGLADADAAMYAAKAVRRTSVGALGCC